jgi:hypothetical protein
VSDRAQELASGDWFESGLERHFAGLENFESAAPVDMAGEFQKDRVAAGESFRVAGALPKNLSSMKISAPSGSEETATVPTPSGADDGAIFDDSEDSAPSLARSWLAF